MNKLLKRLLVMAIGLSLFSSTHLVSAAGSLIQSTVCNSSSTNSTPVINYPANGISTSADVINVQGQATPGASVTISNNGHLTASVVVPNSGDFDVQTPISVGTNHIFAQSNFCGSSTQSVTTTIFGLATPTQSNAAASAAQKKAHLPITTNTTSTSTTTQPVTICPSSVTNVTPVITYPLSSTGIQSNAVDVQGQATAGATVTVYVNNQLVGPVISLSSGEFHIKVLARDGTNHVFAKADLCGSILQSITTRFVVSRPSSFISAIGGGFSYFLIISFIMMLIILWLIWRRYKSKRDQQEKLKLIKGPPNPTGL